MSFELTVEVEGLEENREFFNRIEPAEGVSKKLEIVAQKIVAFAQTIAPKVTGFYAANISYRMLGPMEFEIVAGAPYSTILEEGSRPHIIVPVQARALRFEIGGEIIFAKRVMHPGTIGQGIIAMSIRQFYHEIPEAVEEGATESVEDP